MFGSLGSLKPGGQGGGHVRKRSREEDPASGLMGPAPRPRQPDLTRPDSRPKNALEASIQQQNEKASAETNGKRMARHLPEWMAAGQRVGYLSSSGRVCEGLIDSVNLLKAEVKFVFAEDPDIWKRIPFTTIMSKANPLRRLAIAGDRSKGMNEMLNAAQSSKINKSEMFTRLGLEQTSAQASAADAESVHSGSSVAAAPGGEKDNAGARSRSRSPIPVGSAAEEARSPTQQLPEWIAAGKKARYLSQSSGKYCDVDIDSVSKGEVKIIFVADRSVWKGIPFSMILSGRNPLKPHLEAVTLTP